MVSPTVLPGDAFAEHLRRSTLLFHYRAQDLGLRTVDRSATGTFTRASLGGLVSGRGQITDAADTDVRLVGPHADNQPRFEVSAAGIPHLLLEAARTNGWTYSEQLNNGVWVKALSSISINAVAAPDGLTTADKLVEDGTANVLHRIIRATPTLTDNTKSAVFFYAKAAERSEILVDFVDKSNTETKAWFDLSAGTVGTSTMDTARITALGTTGWYRIEIVQGAASGATSPSIEFRLGSGSEDDVYDGDGSSGLYLWGLQFEADQPFASSYMPTVGSTVTRAVETLSFPFLPVPQEMTILATFVERGTIGTVASGVWGIIDAAGNAPALRVLATGGVYIFDHFNGVTSVTSVLGTGPAFGDLVELRVTLSANGSVQLHQTINGAAETSGAASGALALAAAWSGPALRINDRDLGSAGFNAFISIKIESGTKTLTQMQEAL